jgi:hypothetical protein
MKTKETPKEFKELPTVMEKVKFLLETNPLLRDNDQKLVMTYYFNEIGHDDMITLTAMEFFRKVSNMTRLSTIERMRRVLQNKHPELRGEQYKLKTKKKSNWFVVGKKE